METLALIEWLDGDGQVRHAVRVTQWPVRVGRAIDCDVVLDDPHVAAHHASLSWRDGGVHVEPAASVNGVRLGRATVVAGSMPRLPPSGEFRLGTTTLRVRLAGEDLAPEQPLLETHRGGARRAAWLTALVAVTAGWAGFNQWLGSAPGDSGTQMTGLYLAAPIGLAVWCGLWALVSKLFQRQFAFWPHLAVALFWPLVAVLAETISGQLAFALSMPGIAKAGHVVAIAAIAMLLWRHLGIVLPKRRRAFAWGLAGVVALGASLDVVERMHHQQPLVGGLYLDTISLPALRLAKPVAADAFVRSAQPLEKTLSRWSKASGDEGESEDDDGDDDDADQ